MQQDLLDAVEWVIQQECADRYKIAIMVHSYGGCASLMGLPLTPQVFACGIDLCGPCDIKTTFSSNTPMWQSTKKDLLLRVGDAENDEAFNKRITPLFHADKI